MTHWMADTVVCRSRPMVAIATLTIVVSSREGMSPTQQDDDEPDHRRVELVPGRGLALRLGCAAHDE